MINVNLLKSIWVAKGDNQSDAASAAGLSSRQFSRRLKKGVLGSDEIDRLVARYEIKDPIPVFFAQLVTSKATKVPYKRGNTKSK